MDLDDFKPRPSRQVAVGDDLTALSVTDLEARVAMLKAEIQRTEAEIAVKSARKSAADALFRKTDASRSGD